MYADKMTDAIQACLKETKRRRAMQDNFNRENGITPETIRKSFDNVLASIYESDYVTVPAVAEEMPSFASPKEIPAMIDRLKEEMLRAARGLDFETAAEIRDRIKALSRMELELRG
jgi:excinuclease ABC subunit B